METLDGGLFDPIATKAGFFNAPLPEVVDAFRNWQLQLISVESVDIKEVRDAFPYCLAELDPLVRGGSDRYILADVGNDWTAYFDNGNLGTDPDAPVRHLTRTHLWSGVTVSCKESLPHRNGSLQFSLIGPLKTEWMNYVRSVSLTEDNGRWSFNVGGTPQPFEDLEAYTARRKLDRFTPEMLGAYCEALGFDPFDWTHYGLTYLVTTPLTRDAKRISLAERRAEIGIAD